VCDYIIHMSYYILAYIQHNGMSLPVVEHRNRPGRSLVAIPSTHSRLPDVTNYNENCWRQDESPVYIKVLDLPGWYDVSTLSLGADMW